MYQKDSAEGLCMHSLNLCIENLLLDGETFSSDTSCWSSICKSQLWSLTQLSGIGVFLLPLLLVSQTFCSKSQTILPLRMPLLKHSQKPYTRFECNYFKKCDKLCNWTYKEAVAVRRIWLKGLGDDPELNVMRRLNWSTKENVWNPSRFEVSCKL